MGGFQHPVEFFVADILAAQHDILAQGLIEQQCLLCHDRKQAPQVRDGH